MDGGVAQRRRDDPRWTVRVLAALAFGALVVGLAMVTLPLTALSDPLAVVPLDGEPEAVELEPGPYTVAWLGPGHSRRPEASDFGDVSVVDPSDRPVEVRAASPSTSNAGYDEVLSTLFRFDADRAGVHRVHARAGGREAGTGNGELVLVADVAGDHPNAGVGIVLLAAGAVSAAVASGIAVASRRRSTTPSGA